MPDAAPPNVMEQIVSLCKRRGFIYPASEIYGGLRGFWDYGPLGVLLKNNIRDHWWRDMVECPPIGPDGHPVDDRRPRLGHHPASQNVGGQRPRRQLQRPHGRRPRDQVAVPGRPRQGARPARRQGNSYAFVDDREAAERKVKRDAKRNVPTTTRSC